MIPHEVVTQCISVNWHFPAQDELENSKHQPHPIRIRSAHLAQRTSLANRTSLLQLLKTFWTHTAPYNILEGGTFFFTRR